VTKGEEPPLFAADHREWSRSHKVGEYNYTDVTGGWQGLAGGCGCGCCSGGDGSGGGWGRGCQGCLSHLRAGAATQHSARRAKQRAHSTRPATCTRRRCPRSETAAVVGDYEDVEDELDRLKGQLKDASEVRSSMAAVIDRCGPLAAAAAAAVTAVTAALHSCAHTLHAGPRLAAYRRGHTGPPSSATDPPLPLPSHARRIEADCAMMKRGPQFMAMASLYKDMRIRGIKAEMERLKTWLKNYRRTKDEF
jgi:hypothetical protein